MSYSPHERRSSPAAERNRGPILEVLRRVLPASGQALEIASGTGQHAAWFARALPGWTWQPTDVDDRLLPSIAAWTGERPAFEEDEGRADGSGDKGADDGVGLPLLNVLPPRRLDVLQSPWPVDGPFDLIFCANMLHIAPWACCAALMQGGMRHLAVGGRLVTYGPYLVAGEPLATSNTAFDADLRARDPAWGLRSLDDVQCEAERAGLKLHERIAMPANNQLLIFGESR